MMTESSIHKAAEAIWRWYSAVIENPSRGPAYKHEIGVITAIIRHHITTTPPPLANNGCDSTELLLITEELAKELRSPHSTPSVIQALLMQFGEEIKRGAIEP